jgi:hypothetical protein
MELRRTTSVLKNPSYDGRARYGDKAIKHYAAGTMFEVRRSERYDFINGARVLLPDGKHLWVSTPEVAQLFEQHSEPAAPRTVFEVMFACDLPTNCSDDVLCQLFKDSVITLEQIRNAAQAAMAD